tara:strand:- start:674 stop:1069 length:396 start_codon:yes stop_codon:yes gene_type:complete
MGQDEDQSAFVEKEKFLQRTPVIHNKNKRKEKKEGFGEGRPVLRRRKFALSKTAAENDVANTRAQSKVDIRKEAVSSRTNGFFARSFSIFLAHATATNAISKIHTATAIASISARGKEIKFQTKEIRTALT